MDDQQVNDDMIHPKTHVHITESGIRYGPEFRVYKCGCEYRKSTFTESGGKWWLCQFHQGYDAGLEAR